MTVSLHAVSAVVGSTSLDVQSGTAKLDEGWAPYAQASLTIALPNTATQALLDPRTDARVTITAARSTLAGTAFALQSTRIFNLLLRGRTIDHNADTMQLTLASDEALLQDAKLIDTAPDTSALLHQSSVRAIVSNALADVGATLSAGTIDADFTTLTDVTNLCTCPSVEHGSTTGWGVGSNCTITTDTAHHFSGTTSVKMIATGSPAGAYVVGAPPGSIAVTPGTTYTASVRVLAAATARTANVSIYYYNSAGTILSPTFTGAAVPTSTSSWARPYCTAVAPAGAAHMYVLVFVTGTVSGEVNYLDAAMVVEGDGLETDGVNLIPEFDGDSTTTTNYTYAWTGPAGASTSTRTPRFSRTPDALTRQPGQSWWTLLAPVLQQTGLRLFCDEQRVWQLVNNSYALPGRVTVAEGFNVYTATDTISRDQTSDDGTPAWYDACVIKYSWIDSAGVQQTMFDAYAADGATQTAYFEEQTAYPGPGVAKYRVGRSTGQGRVLNLVAAVDYDATPGMEASATLPGTDDQSGYTSSVSWDFSADTMTVGTRGLIDTDPESWLAIPGDPTWDNIPGDPFWDGWTW